MGRQSKTIRNKRKIKVENYDNNYSENPKDNKVLTKTFTREAQFTIISIFLVTIVMISSAYAIFSSVQKQGEYNTITVGTLKIDFNQSSSDMGNIIKLNGAYPTSDVEGQKTNPYSFKITNSGTLDAYYKVKIVDDTDIIKEDGCENNLLPKDKIKVSINKGTPFLLNSKENNQYIISEGYLAASKNKSFEIRIWIDETAGNEVLGKHYHGKIVVEGKNATEDDADILCKRATELHTEICSKEDTSGYCQADGYASGATITYGNETTTEGKLNTGDAFDCDIDGDKLYGEKDETTGKYTERFYYITDMDTNTAILIYYNNVSGGVANNLTTFAYNTDLSDYLGPQTAIEQLPTTTQWKNVKLTNSTRNILDDTGTVKINGFNYGDKAARLLTYQEVNLGCTNNTEQLVNRGILSKNCKFLLENTNYSGIITKIFGIWLETPNSSAHNYAWRIIGDARNLNDHYININDASYYTVRPVIEVPKSKILY